MYSEFQGEGKNVSQAVHQGAEKQASRIVRLFYQSYCLGQKLFPSFSDACLSMNAVTILSFSDDCLSMNAVRNFTREHKS